MVKIIEAKEQSQGVFWIIDDELYAFPFLESEYLNAVAKSGGTYNHKRLWNDIKPKGCNKSYNYYPRGRVVINSSNKAVIYMNPNIDQKFIKDIKIQFGILGEPKINYDNSEHYKCYLDDGWKAEK